MAHRIVCAAVLLCAGVVPCVHAQLEKLPVSELNALRAQIPALEKTVPAGALRDHLSRQKTNPAPLAAANAARVAADLAASKNQSSAAPFAVYAVPAMSEMQRLPDAYPVDGKVNAPVRIIAAGGEFEPGSFVVYPFRDLGKVALSLGEFKTKDGKVFPKDALDLKVVKVWYQNGNGWYSYFGDTELKLVPELLLNDEDLVKVDTKNVQNYARLTDPKTGEISYFWITPPRELDNRRDFHYASAPVFRSMRPDFRDAESLRPVTLDEGAFKQFFLTARVDAKTAPGTYYGSISLSGKDVKETVPVTIRVLPFQLPSPKTYFDVNRDYITSFYSYVSFSLIMDQNGGDPELAKKQFYNILVNEVQHNQTMRMMRAELLTAHFLDVVSIMKKAGMRTDLLMGGGVARYNYGGYGNNVFSYAHHAKMAREWAMKNFGHTNILLGYGDEPGASWIMDSRPVFRAYQDQGFKFFIAGSDTVFYKAGYIYDAFNIAKPPETAEATRKWNEIGNAYVAWYAGQHVGPENPAFNRRQYGIAPYLANFSATCNYAHHLGPWNDRSTTYRPMVFAYGTYDGVVDTIQWEGYREGLDDIRYATLLKTLALKAVESKNIDTVYAGRQTLQFFAEMDPATVELQSTRLEMIQRILHLQNLLKK